MRENKRSKAVDVSSEDGTLINIIAKATRSVGEQKVGKVATFSPHAVDGSIQHAELAAVSGADGFIATDGDQRAGGREVVV